MPSEATSVNAAKDVPVEKKPAVAQSVKSNPVRVFIAGKTVRKEWQLLWNNLHTQLKKMSASKCGDVDASHNKTESDCR
jgi:hypothetical protein